MKSLKRFLPLLKLAFSAGIIAFLYARSDRTAFAAILRAADPRWIIPFYAICLVNTALSAAKWRLLLQADGIHIRLGSLTASYLIGTFFNLFLPSSIGGDSYRVYDVARRSSRAAEGFASVFADRLTGFLALATWGLVFSVIAFTRVPNPALIWIPVLFFGLLAALTTALLQRRLLLWGLRITRLDRVAKVYAFAEKFLGSIDTYRRNPRLLAQTMAISFAFQFLLIVAVWMVGRMLGVPVGFTYFCAFVPMVTLLEALPITVFGLGVRDASYAFFFSQVGASREQGLSLALAYLALTVGYSLIGGLVFVLRRGGTQSSPVTPP
jgi:uncharacterized protein (TIRG00374 family)